MPTDDTRRMFTTATLICQVVSTVAASYMLLRIRHTTALSTKLIFYRALSDVGFSLTGAIANVLALRNAPPSWPIDVFLKAPHWSLEISSFLWSIALALYILFRQNQRGDFSMIFTHTAIWSLTLLYAALEIYALESSSQQVPLIARVVWDTLALIALVTVLYALCSFRAHKIRSGQLGQSVVMGKLLGYMLIFLAFVTPNLTNDVWFFATGAPTPTPDDAFANISSILFALWPTGNCIVFLSKVNCYRPPTLKADEAAPPLSPTQELHGLEIGEKIGQGLAVVYRGKWRGAVVAVKMKMLLLDNNHEALDPAFLHECNVEIQQEAIVMKRLTHPNIVLFMEAGFYQGSICIISEYCARGSLRDVLSNAYALNGRSIIWPMKIRLALGLAYGLQYLHNSQMIHRDLKSPNILVDETWHAKIADFGTLRLAEIVRSQNHHVSPEMTGLVGTTRWMAPEVIKGNKQYTEKIDIYSLGVILWELIDGRKLPYDEIRWNHQIEAAIVQGKRPTIIANSCPPRWKVLVSMCWQVDPTQRPTIAQLIRSLHRVAKEDIKDALHKNLPFVGNLQQMDCDYILKNTRCEVDIEPPGTLYFKRTASDVSLLSATSTNSHLKHIPLLEETNTGRSGGKSSFYALA
ncbi:TKL protein kinase [Saprolegnia diclina VS20]|uniref:TKL protein kinase n=1 Tax=Saprolegnia diclina (strain VS20) TaxID=1156394 RepID=T0RZ74_SAPDV|nr:TKL protein kinase [Saprolegnia diclina VS20]EQC35647.1 TKL protein kinase [Saprolegnia diclina VS20]|eukprot:XP_008610964.1 TKL protein kinase [Saprolegnia diclina VS20]